MLVSSVQEFSCGLEARISGWLGDEALTFFDPLYCLNRDRYRDALVDVELAGIAYSLRVVPSGDRRQESAAVLLPAAPEDDSGDRSRQSGDERALGVAYVQQPAPHVETDDYQFRARVNDVQQFEIGKIPVWKFRSTVLRVHRSRTEIDIDIYATREAMREAAAIPGDEIAGTLWLQGILLVR